MSAAVFPATLQIYEIICKRRSLWAVFSHFFKVNTIVDDKDTKQTREMEETAQFRF